MKLTIMECHGRFLVESDVLVADLVRIGPPRYMQLTTHGTLARTGGRWDARADAEGAIKRFNIMAGR